MSSEDHVSRPNTHESTAESAIETPRPHGKGGVGATRGLPKSQKLGRTIEELENAFSEWESLSQTLATQAAGHLAPLPLAAHSQGAGSAGDPLEEDFRKKTKKLLCQLREQLSELNDEI